VLPITIKQSVVEYLLFHEMATTNEAADILVEDVLQDVINYENVFVVCWKELTMLVYRTIYKGVVTFPLEDYEVRKSSRTVWLKTKPMSFTYVFSFIGDDFLMKGIGDLTVTLKTKNGAEYMVEPDETVHTAYEIGKLLGHNKLKKEDVDTIKLDFVLPVFLV